MTDDQAPQSPPPGASAPTTPPPTDRPASTPSTNVSLAILIWVGIGVVVLSFVASFLGASLARAADSTDSAAESATLAPTVDEVDEAAYEEAIEEILPAGSAVRAGAGVPESGKGYEGDVYIDISTADVYLFRDGDWTLVGNIRTEAAENLTGVQGPAGVQGPDGERGETGATGEQGAAGEPGAPGTQVTLGLGAPDGATCTAGGDIYIDTETVAFYECTAGEWTLFGPTSTPEPAPTEEPEEG